MTISASSRNTDLITQLAALCLALICLAFASYKVMKLNGMENPPADMGLNFPPPKRKIITDEPVLVDSLTTGSFDPFVDNNASRPLQPYAADAPIQDYRLLKVMNGLAYVEIETLRGKDIKLLSEGSFLPGAGTVQQIFRLNGQWTLIAGDVTLRQQAQ